MVIIITITMATTVQINESTRQMLERIKDMDNIPTFDQVISELAKERIKVPKSLFGKGKITRFKKEDKLKFHEL